MVVNQIPNVEGIGDVKVGWEVDFVGIVVDLSEDLARTHFSHLQFVVCSNWEPVVAQMGHNQISFFECLLPSSFISLSFVAGIGLLQFDLGVDNCIDNFLGSVFSGAAGSWQIW